MRRDADTVALTLVGKAGASDAGAAGAAAAKLLVHDFDFNGAPVATDKVHLKQVAPGVVEITSMAWEVGYWRFLVHDAASYFGLGERFDALDHAHTVVKNLSTDTSGVKGSSSYKPIPFFMSTTGYGLWVDTTGEATFDMNASDRDEIVVDVTAAKLRIVLIRGAGVCGDSGAVYGAGGPRGGSPNLGVCAVEGEGLPPERGAGCGGCGQDAGAGAAGERDPDRLAVGDDLQRLQVQSQAVRRRAGDGEAHSR